MASITGFGGMYGLTGASAVASWAGGRYPLRYLFSNSDLVYALSPADFPVLESIGVNLDNVRVVPNGVKPEFLERESADVLADLRRKYGFPTDGTPLLLFVGHLRQKKGVDVLIKAMGQVPGKWHLAIVGPQTFPELARN